VRASSRAVVVAVLLSASLPGGLALLHARAPTLVHVEPGEAATSGVSAPPLAVQRSSSPPSYHGFARLHRRAAAAAARGPADWPAYGGTLSGTHAADPAAGVNATDVATLREAWRSPTLGAVSGSPVVAAGGVFVEDLRGNVTRLDAHNGSLVWTVSVGAPLSGTPAVADGRVFVVTLPNATLFAIDARQGTLLWSRPVAPTSAGWGSPVVADGLVLVGASGGDDGYAPPDHAGSVQAFDAATGALAWRTFLATSAQPGSAVWTTPAVANGLVVVGTGNPNGDESRPGALTDSIVALRLANGTVAWSRQFFPSTGGDSIDDDFGSSPVVYATSDTGRLVVAEAQKYGQLHVLDAASGDPIATTRQPALDLIGSPAVGDGCLYLARQVTQGNGALECLSADAKASLVWSAPLGETFSSPASAPGLVLAASDDGILGAYSAANGARLWSATLPGATDSSPVVAEGLVLIGYQSAWSADATGGVVAYAPAPGG
jgi:polyvinyl alcohol dehydrogenase (cytochrome)